MNYEIVCRTMKNRVAIDTEKLIRIRENRRLSRVDIAARLKYSEKQIYNLETGRGRVSIRLVDAVCGVLEITPEDIEVGGKVREGTQLRRHQKKVS